METSSLTVSRESITEDDMRLPALLVAIELLTQDGAIFLTHSAVVALRKSQLEADMPLLALLLLYFCQVHCVDICSA